MSCSVPSREMCMNVPASWKWLMITPARAFEASEKETWFAVAFLCSLSSKFCFCLASKIYETGLFHVSLTEQQ